MGLSSYFRYWPADPLGLDAENIAHAALVHVGEFCVCRADLCSGLVSLAVCVHLAQRADHGSHPSSQGMSQHQVTWEKEPVNSSFQVICYASLHTAL